MGKIVFIFGQLLNKGYFYGELIFIFFKASINIYSINSIESKSELIIPSFNS